ncbi:ABC transporter related protein [Candidatus Puniceispirillum marinum IMCC1322]|uniref:ABC transporter related protein n=2 Tax=Candidatus Puniceispirillum TaxID=767891 RepID=D5BU08_PUNMI|nr:ABC transporter related protein [Candidatus Puniceispirillum marinum IMCC1322]
MINLLSNLESGIINANVINMANVYLSGLSKKFGGVTVVDKVDVDIAHGEFIVLVGPSGCGKSTTLRMIAGLEDLTEGDIRIGDQNVNFVQPKDRDVAMVFQNYALYPHMNVYKNISISLSMRGVNRVEIDRRVKEAAAILGLEDLLKRLPKQLSGGQRQRVAMGRAIVRQPAVFLFDEPLSNLDAKLRVQMRTEIKKIHQRVATTIIYVTHDQTEAMTLADRIVVMNEGKIEQVGPPQQLYDEPKTKFVASFIGSPGMNFVGCEVVKERTMAFIKISSDVLIPLPEKYLSALDNLVGRKLELGFRPEHMTEPRSYDHGHEFEVDIDVLEPLGNDTMVYFDFGGQSCCARVLPSYATNSGTSMALELDLSMIHLVDSASNLIVRASGHA